MVKLKDWWATITPQMLNDSFASVAGNTMESLYNVDGLSNLLYNKIGQYCHRLMHRYILDWEGNTIDSLPLDEETQDDMYGAIVHQIENLANAKENMIAASNINNGKDVMETKVNPINNDFSDGTAGLLTTTGQVSFNNLDIQERANNLIEHSSFDFEELYKELQQMVSREE